MDAARFGYKGCGCRVARLASLHVTIAFRADFPGRQPAR